MLHTLSQLGCLTAAVSKHYNSIVILKYFIYHVFYVNFNTESDSKQLNNVNEILDLIWEARTTFNNLGMALGLSPHDITAIKQSNHYVTEDCFIAVMTDVVNQGVTQEDLARALESTTVRQNVLAQKVRDATLSSSKIQLCIGQTFAHEHAPLIFTL